MPSLPRSVTVGSTPTLLWRTVTGQRASTQLETTTETTVTVAAGKYRSGTSGQPLYIVVANNGTSTIYLGTKTVATTTGLPLVKAGSLAWQVAGNDQIWGIVATGSVNARVLVGPAPR